MASFTLSDGQSINIPNIEYGIYTTSLPNVPNWHNENYYYYQRGQDAATFVDLTGYAAQCDAKGDYGNWNNLYSAGQYLRSPHSKTDYEAGGTGRAILDGLSEKGVWLWGSWSDGGVFMIKTSNGRYHLFSFMQLYENSSDQYIYSCNTMSVNNADGLSLTELQAVAFTSHETIDGIRSCDIDYLPDGRYYKFFVDYNYSPIPGDPPMDQQLILQDVKEAMGVSKYNTHLAQAFPARAWRCCTANGETLGEGTKRLGRDYSQVVPTGFYYKGGSIWDEAQIDPASNPYADAGSSTNNNGDTGDWTDESDPIDFTNPEDWTTDAVNSGFFTLYNPTKSQVQAFNDFLFTGITDSIALQLKKLIADPLDYLVFISMCHFVPKSTGTGAIKFCGIDSGVTSNVIDKQMQEVDCGSVDLYGASGEEETRSFMGYEPYYKISIYLPYCGTHVLKADDFQNSRISVKYNIDLLTGSCVAEVKATRSSRKYKDPSLDAVICTFTGNVYQNLPLTATDWRGLYSSVMQFVGGLVTAGAGGNAAAGVAQMANAVVADKMTVSRSGQIGSNYGYMAHQKPYLIVSRPTPNIPVGFNEFEGFPTYEIKRIGEVSGYTEIDPESLRTDGFDGILAEEAEILRDICSTGFYA